jgi:predicted SAM-dependent methyltransferase
MKTATRRLRSSVKAGLVWLRWRATRPAHPQGDALRIHLGCGDIDEPGFVNIDARPAPHVHHVQGIARLDAFADDTADLIYASHCLEHVPHREMRVVLREWRRVLKPGGVLRLSVPDFDHIVDTYLDTGRELRSVQEPVMGEQNYPFNFHYTLLNFNELSRRLVDAGFRAPRRWQPGTGPFTSLPDWSGRSMTYGGKTYPVSLNVEAEK